MDTIRTPESERQNKSQHGSEAQNVGNWERALSATIGALGLVSALRRGGIRGLLTGLAGGALVYRAASGHCAMYEKLGIDTSSHSGALGQGGQGTKVVESITINRSPEEVYRFWRDLSNLPKFMKHLSHVEPGENGDSYWVASGPAGKTIEWGARIINETPNELIAWESLPGSDFESKGSVRFERAPGGRGTELTVSLVYRPPLGKLGVLGAKLLHQAPEQQLREDLRRLRQLLEAGELATSNAS